MMRVHGSFVHTSECQLIQLVRINNFGKKRTSKRWPDRLTNRIQTTNLQLISTRPDLVMFIDQVTSALQ